LLTIAALAVARLGPAAWGLAATYSFLLAAVMISSWLSGVGPGLLSTLLGTVGADYLLIEPVGSVTFDASRLIQLSAFILVAVLISSLNDSRRRATAALRAERGRLAERVEQRTAELSRAERNFRGLIESAPDAIIAADPAGRILRVNSEAERLFGFDRLRLVGADVELLIPEGDRPKLRAALESFVAHPQVRTIEGELFGRRADGTEFPVEVRVSSLESEDGLLIVGIVRNITERYEAQRAQQRLVHDLNERVKELTALHSAARLLNENADVGDLLTRIVAMLPAAWQYPEVTEARIAVGDREVSTAGFRATDWMLRGVFGTPAGDHGMLEVAYVEPRPAEAEGPFLAEERSLVDSLAELLQAYFERIHAEADRLGLARAEAARIEAQQANHAKDQFLATLSHELRAPLNVTLGWTRMLRSGQLPPDAAARGLEVLERSVKLQAQLIEDLLDVSRIVTDKLRIERQRVDLASLASQAIDAARPAADARKIQLTASVDAPLWMDADPARLQQIVSNVLTNALKFTPEHGAVKIRVHQEGGSARIIVTDSGIGIAPDLLPFIFERFRQGDSSTTRSHSGLGLGLAIVKRLVDLHDGRIEACSAGKGKGATFTIDLPLAFDAAAVMPADRPPDQALLSGIRVLVVDDDADARLTLMTMLNQYGASATAVDSADGAVAALAREPADVLLSDIAMPKQDGYDLIRRIRQHQRSAVLPAASLSAYADADHRSRALEAGFQEHLAKPVEPALLARTIARLVHRA
jgi:PAS domain S-box-containing protein